ncbi:MAG: hypothetical protein ACYCVY_11295 [Acidiferrobacteraceae bacterium]
MKKLAHWVFWLPERTGAVRQASLYSRLAGQYLLWTTLISLVTSVTLTVWLAIDPAGALHAFLAVVSAMNAGSGWLVDHQILIWLWLLPFALILHCWAKRERIVAAWRAMVRIIRIIKTEGRNI